MNSCVKEKQNKRTKLSQFGNLQFGSLCWYVLVTRTYCVSKAVDQLAYFQSCLLSKIMGLRRVFS